MNRGQRENELMNSNQIQVVPGVSSLKAYAAVSGTFYALRRAIAHSHLRLSALHSRHGLHVASV
jgi:precorrin-2 methylase